MLANLTGEETAIRPLVLPHPDAAILWTAGAYPPQVAEMLSRHYREMKVERILEEPDHVVLRATGEPAPLELRRLEGAWRLDASPIIAFRKPSPPIH